MYIFLRTVNYRVSVTDLTSERICMLTNLKPILVYILYTLTRLSLKSAAVFTADAVSGHFDLTFAELRVEEATQSSPSKNSEVMERFIRSCNDDF